MLTGAAKRLGPEHLDRMIEIYQTRSVTMRIKITQTIDEYLRKSFDVATQNQLGHSAWGHFNSDGKLIMFATKSHWSSMPYWTVGNVFVDKDESFVHLKDGLLIQRDFLQDIFLDSAINHNRFQGFMARDYRHVVATVGGTNKLGSDIRKPSIIYVANFAEVVPPYSRARFEYGSNVLGILEGRNPNPVIIRSYHLKPEFNQELAKYQNHSRFINAEL